MNLELDRSQWKRVKFGDVVQKSKEKVDPADGTVSRVIGGEHMDSNDLKIHRWGNVDDGYLGPAFHSRFRPGQVLYGSRRTYLRKVAVADFDGVCANTTFVLDSKEPNELLPAFLPWVMTSEAFHAFANAESRGSVNPYVNFSDIAKYEFGLPPLDHQQRIADLLWATEKEGRACMHVSQAMATLLNTRRMELMSHGAVCNANEVFDIEIGRQRAPKYQVGDHPVAYLRSANVKPGLLNLDDILRMDFSTAEIEKFGLQRGDILVTEGCGSPEEVGAPARWSGDLAEPVCFQNTLLRYRATPGVDAEWLWQWIQYAFESGLFRDTAAGTGILHIGLKRARMMSVRVPPLSEQEQIVAELAHITLALADSKKRKEAVISLAKSIREAAFTK